MRVTGEISPGTLIDRRYCVRRVLGEGGMGRTYLATDQRCFEEPCVLKEFLPIQAEPSLRQKAQELFEREARVLHQLTHPQIPRFLACFTEGERLFLVEEYIDGKNYQTLLEEKLAAQDRGFLEVEILQWLKNLLPVLVHIHRCGVIHRDISPDNIMLPNPTTPSYHGRTQESLPVLIDFGVVKQAITEVSLKGTPKSNASGQTSFVGKLGYSPPEQMRTGQCYPNSDLYSLAVTALVLLTGKPPSELFDGYAMEWQWQSHAQLSDRFAQILGKMLAEKPQDRYASAEEVFGAISELSKSQYQLTVVSQTQRPVLKTRSTPRLKTPTTPQNAIAHWFSTLLKPPATGPSDLKVRSNEGNLAPWKVYSGLAIAAVSCAFLFVSSAVVGLNLPDIAWLCKPLNACARDEEFQQLYDRIVQQETTARLLSRPPQSLEDLENVRDRLQQTLAQLKTIPENTKVHTAAQPILAYYRNELKQLDARIAAETTAAKQLAAIEKLARNSTQNTERSATLWRLEDAKADWENILNQLNQIPSNTFIASRIATRRREYQEKISRIEAQIERLGTKQRQRNTPQSATSPSPQESPE